MRTAMSPLHRPQNHMASQLPSRSRVSRTLNMLSTLRIHKAGSNHNSLIQASHLKQSRAAILYTIMLHLHHLLLRLLAHTLPLHREDGQALYTVQTMLGAHRLQCPRGLPAQS
jgi:hypothetical protein